MELFVFLLPCAAAGHRPLEGSDQLVFRDRLGQQIVGARLHDLDGGGDVRMSCQEDDGQVRAQGGQPVLQVRPAQAGDPDVEKDAARTGILRQSLQQPFRRFIGLDSIARGTQKTLGCGAERLIVINDVHDG